MSSKSEKLKRKQLKQAYKESDVPVDPFLRRLHEARAFRTFSPSDAAATPDEELEWRVVVVVHNHIGTDFKHEEEIVSRFSNPVKAVFATWMVETEVMNGGFDQFFFNQRPYLGELAVQGYEFLGCPKQMRAVQTAISRHKADLADFKDQDGIINDLWRSSLANKAKRIRAQPEVYAIDEDT